MEPLTPTLPPSEDKLPQGGEGKSVERMNLKGKKVIVVGLGKSGLSACLLLKELGAEVSVTDSSDNPSLRRNAGQLRGARIELGRHTRGFIEGQDLVVASPGVPDDSPALVWAEGLGIKVIGEIELGHLFCKNPVVAVTGTNGKSTTVSLIGEMFESAGNQALVCGNIGRPFCGEVLGLKRGSPVVLEVSSFQLERTDTFKPNVAVVLNATQNHLDRHKDMEQYVRAKARIFRNQDGRDWAILNSEDPRVKTMEGKSGARTLFFAIAAGKPNFREGAFVIKDEVVICLDGKVRRVCKVDEVGISGRHNLENALAAVLVGAIWKVPEDAMAGALKSFAGLEHRFEYVESINGIKFINDSKATTVDAAAKALEASQGPVVLIAGGRDKGSDFTIARDFVRRKAKAVVLIGESKEKIRSALESVVPVCDAHSLEEAVEMAYKRTCPGEAVLLSPMCASFDMFSDFEERGRAFKEIVKELGKRLKVKGER